MKEYLEIIIQFDSQILNFLYKSAYKCVLHSRTHFICYYPCNKNHLKTTPVHYVEHVDDWEIITPNCTNCNERE